METIPPAELCNSLSVRSVCQCERVHVHVHDERLMRGSVIVGLREANRETRNHQDTESHKNGNCFSDKRKGNPNLGLKVNISLRSRRMIRTVVVSILISDSICHSFWQLCVVTVSANSECDGQLA